MLEPAILTVVAPIRKTWDTCAEPCPHEDRKCDSPECCLKRLLREEMDRGWLDSKSRHLVPRDDDRREEPDIGQRPGEFDFKALHGLHCCSFVVAPSATKKGFLCGRVELDACLIMEATFDGSMEDFLHNLVDTNSAQLHRIFRFCEGFPENAERHPELMADFLQRKHVPHNTYFSGVPGRSISEIRTEALMRTRLSKYLKDKYLAFRNGSPGERPRAKFRDLQRELRNEVRKDAEISMTEERPALPWSVRNGSLVMLAAGGALAAVFLLLTWSLFWCLGIGYQDIRSLVQTRLIGEGAALTPQLQVIGYLLAYWAIIRILRYLLTPDARPRLYRGPCYLAVEFLQTGLLALRLSVFVAGLAIALKLIARDDPVSGIEFGGYVVLAIVASIAFYFAVHYRAAPLRRIELGPAASRKARFERAEDRVIVDAVAMIRLIWCIAIYTPIAILFDWAVIGWWWSGWATCLLAVLVCLTAIGIYLFAAMILLLAVKDLLMLIAWGLEAIERWKYFAPANTLSERASRRSHIWAGEEHRTHLYQNHFASQTLVKNLPRMLYLRLTLTLVNFLARFFYNKGELGGIPTIFSARWVLLDRGHRLIFLTNFVGAWDSYLGEFSDLNAYVGVNAIWTNTYVPLSEQEKEQLGTGELDVAFPRSSLYIFGGAAFEQPFKAYVRQSQIETLAWYGAYPRLSVPNINDNSRIRRDLFRKLSTAELDALFKRI